MVINHKSNTCFLIIVLYFWLHDENQVNESSNFYALFFPHFWGLKTSNSLLIIFLKIYFFLPVNKMLKRMYMVFDTQPQSATPFWQENGQWITSLGCWICLTLGICHTKINPTILRLRVGLFARGKKWVGLFISGDKKAKVMESIAKPFCCTHSSIDWKI